MMGINIVMLESVEVEIVLIVGELSLERIMVGTCRGGWEMNYTAIELNMEAEYLL
jgi:hypothetical protein